MELLPAAIAILHAVISGCGGCASSSGRFFVCRRCVLRAEGRAVSRTTPLSFVVEPVDTSTSDPERVCPGDRGVEVT